MTHFTTHSMDIAPATAKPILEGALNGYGFVPNLYATMAEAPAILEGYTTLAGIFGKTDLAETERQIILMTNNRLNGCAYCMAAHTTLSQMAGVAQDVIDAQVEAFLAAGYTRQTVLEVILGTALKTLSNYTNHIAKTDLDPAFVPNRWMARVTQAAE